MTRHHRYAHDETGVQRRYYELRYDEDKRIVSGTAMRYGDVAELPWGEKERFEPGAFGDIGDVLLNVQHDRSMPLARTTGGTLTLSDMAGALTVEATLPDTTIANDAIANIRAGILRGLSVEFIPHTTGVEDDVIVVSKAELRGIGVVDRPAYPASKLNPRSKGEENMDEKQIRALVEGAVKEALAKRADESKPLDAAAIGTAVASAIAERMEGLPTAESVQASIDAALKQRDEAEAAKREAEEAQRTAETKAAEDRAKAEADAEARAELLVMVTPLIPDGTATRGMSNHDLLVLAAGDEVPGAKDRSEDYLLAKVEAIAERRSDKTATQAPTPASVPSMVGGTGVFSIAGAITQRAAARRAARR